MRRERATWLTLRRLRQRRGLTQADMAEALRIDIRTYERIASGRTRLDLERAFALAETLDCDPVALVAALHLEAPSIAYACADAKVLLALALALQRLTPGEIDDLSRATALQVLRACESLVAELLDRPRP